MWHGVNVSMLISVPMICMYLPMYDNLMAELDTSTTYAPLVAGSAARSMAVVATSPLELLKTRIQAAGAATHSHSKMTSAGINPLSTALQQMRSDLKVFSHSLTASMYAIVKSEVLRSWVLCGSLC